MNPNALVFWLICTCIGFLSSGVRGAIWGLVIGLGVSLLAELLPDRRRR